MFEEHIDGAGCGLAFSFGMLLPSADGGPPTPAPGVRVEQPPNRLLRQPRPIFRVLEEDEERGARLQAALARAGVGDAQPQPQPEPSEPLASAEGGAVRLFMESVDPATKRNAYHTWLADMHGDSGGAVKITHWSGSILAADAPFSGTPRTWIEPSLERVRAYLEAQIKRETTRGVTSEKQKAERYKVVLYHSPWGGFEMNPLRTAATVEAMRSWLAEVDD